MKLKRGAAKLPAGVDRPAVTGLVTQKLLEAENMKNIFIEYTRKNPIERDGLLDMNTCAIFELNGLYRLHGDTVDKEYKTLKNAQRAAEKMGFIPIQIYGGYEGERYV